MSKDNFSKIKFYDAKIQELFEIRKYRAEATTPIKHLLNREKELKREVAEYVKNNGPIVFDGGRIEYKMNQVKRTLQRISTLEYLRNNFGDEIADKVDAHCTTSNTSEGVWTYLAKNRKESHEDDVAIDIISDQISD